MGELVGINIAGLKYCCPLARARLMIPSPVENAHSHKDYGNAKSLRSNTWSGCNMKVRMQLRIWFCYFYLNRLTIPLVGHQLSNWLQNPLTV